MTTTDRSDGQNDVRKDRPQIGSRIVKRDDSSNSSRIFCWSFLFCYRTPIPCFLIGTNGG